MTWTPICASEQTVETIINFLRRRPAKDRSQRMLICTHLALVLAHEEMLRRGYKRPFKKTSLYIDECHHICWDMSSGTAVTNGLGKIVSHYYECRPGKLVLATATFMRPDGQVIPPEYRDKFAAYELPMHEHLASMPHLKGIRFHFVMASAVEAVETIIGGDPHRPTLMWLPNNVIGSAKAPYVKRLVDATPDCIRDRIYDFTDDEQVSEIRERFHRLKLDPVEYPCLGIALRRLLEGVDSPMASRGIILGLRGIRDIIQMVGRFIRDLEGKPYADIYIVVDPPSEDEADVVEHLEDNLSAIFIAMIAGWQYGPARKPRNKAERDLAEKVGKILSNPEATTVVLNAIASAVARHADGEPEQLSAGMHESMRRLAEERPDLADMKDPAVRSRLVEDVDERMAGPAAEAEKKLKYKIPGLKGARDLTGLKLTAEQGLARNITVLGFTCGARSMKMMRESLASDTIELVYEDVREAALRWWEATGKFPHAGMVGVVVDIGGRQHCWRQVNGWLSRHCSSSLGKLRIECTGNLGRGLIPYDLVAEEASEYRARTGEWPRIKSGPLARLRTTWETLYQKFIREGTSLEDFLESRFGPLRLRHFDTYDEWRKHALDANVGCHTDYQRARGESRIDSRFPSNPRDYYGAGWKGWPKDRKVSRGESHGCAKLSDASIKRMRRRFKQRFTKRAVAEEFGVSISTVKLIKSGRIWAHVK
jgi:hypothetical protein